MVGKTPAPERVKKGFHQGPKVSPAQKDAFLKRRQEKVVEITKRAKQYEEVYNSLEADLIKNRKAARADKGHASYFVEPEPKVAFCIRIKGINKIPPKCRKCLQLLRLRQIFNGNFVKLNKSTGAMLRQVEPYVTYGYPTLASVRKLLLKRGFCKHKGQRLRINNDLIELHLGKLGIICLEDLVNQIVLAGPHFREVSNFIWPFQLSAPKGGLRAKRKHFIQGGDAGNREELINPFLKKVV